MLSRILTDKAHIPVWVITFFMLLQSTGAEAKNILKLNPLAEESYAENFTLVTRLENNAYLLVQAMIMNGGVGDEKPACRILYVSSDGQATNEVNRGDDWHYVDRLDKLSIGSCLLQRNASGLIWKAKTDTLSVELILKGKIGRFSNKSMNLNIKDGLYESHILAPHAEVLARIKHKTKQSRQLKGKGLVNHVRSTILPPKLAKRWFKLYAFGADTASSELDFLLLDIRYPPHQSKPIAWSWIQGQNHPKVLKVTSPLLVKDLAQGQLKKGQEFTLQNSTFNYKIEQLNPVFRYEPIRAYGLMGRMLKSWVGDPVNQSSLVEITTPNGKLLGMVEEVLFR